MTDPALNEAGRRFKHAMICHSKGNYKEAYQHYLATSYYISSELYKRSGGEVWCDVNTEKLLDLSLKCMEAAKLINSQQLELNAVLTHNASITSIPESSENSSIPEQDTPVEDKASAEDRASAEDKASKCEGTGDEEEDCDVLSILDMLPEVPANKPGQKYQKPLARSATLPTLPKKAHPEPPGPSNNSSSTLPPRSSNKLPAAFFNPYLPTNYRSLPRSLSANSLPGPAISPSTGEQGNTVTLSVSPLEEAHKKNQRLAAMYEKRAEQGRVNPGWRLELVRAQEVNLNIAREQEKTLAKKSEQRKQRLEQERIEEQNSVVVDDTIGIYEAILYHKTAHIRSFIASAREYDAQHRPGRYEGEDASQAVMESTLSWCFAAGHPVDNAVGSAQYNFVNRISPLTKKIFKAKTPSEREALRDGIRVEVEGITQDIGDMVVNLTRVLTSLYPMFKKDTTLIQLKLSEIFYRPFLPQLLETYNFLNEDAMEVYRAYVIARGLDDITAYTDIKQKYHLGDAPYQAAIDCISAITETFSPIEKFSLLVNFGQTISESVKQFYLDQGHDEDQASEVSNLGADDLFPITLFVITRVGKPQLISELQLLDDITHEQDLMGNKGYCLATVTSAYRGLVAQQTRDGTSGPNI